MTPSNKTVSFIEDTDGVSGFAILNYTGDTFKYTLSLPKETIASLLNALLTTRNDFLDQEKEINGFLLKTNDLNLMVCFFNEFFLLIEVVEGCSLSEIDAKMRSLFSETRITAQF